MEMAGERDAAQLGPVERTTYWVEIRKAAHATSYINKKSMYIP